MNLSKSDIIFDDKIDVTILIYISSINVVKVSKIVHNCLHIVIKYKWAIGRFQSTSDSHLWPPLVAIFLALRVWEAFGARPIYKPIQRIYDIMFGRTLFEYCVRKDTFHDVRKDTYMTLCSEGHLHDIRFGRTH